jgi:hypothetical protein
VRFSREKTATYNDGEGPDSSGRVYVPAKEACRRRFRRIPRADASAPTARGSRAPRRSRVRAPLERARGGRDCSAYVGAGNLDPGRMHGLVPKTLLCGTVRAEAITSRGL